MQTELRTKASAIEKPPLSSGFFVAEHGSSLRSSLEARVRSGFGHHFNACIEGFMPELAVYEHSTGASGVIGIRSAADESLFLENYLDHPVETVVHLVSGEVVDRGSVVEVGQFVVDERDIVADFFRDLVPFLVSQGFDWVCFTGTNRIRALLGRIGFAGFPVTRAAQERLVESRDHWGSYYEQEPVVIVGKLSDPQGNWFRQERRSA
jgi:hypothetical protein